MLPCGHTFCHQCLGATFEHAKSKSKKGKNIECAICKVQHEPILSVHAIPKNYALIPSEESLKKKSIESETHKVQWQSQTKKRSLSEFFSTIESNKLLSSCTLTSASASTLTSTTGETSNMVQSKIENENQFICGVCDDRHHATHCCADCGELMCEDGAKFHKTFKATKGHSILLVHDCNLNNEISQNKIKRNRTDSQLLCKDHGKSLDFFDEDCKKLNCMDCCMTSHKGILSIL
jgi:hypothetical protein